MGDNTSEKARWIERTWTPAIRKAPERLTLFATLSGRSVAPLYDATDIAMGDSTTADECGRSPERQVQRAWSVRRRITQSRSSDARRAIEEAVSAGVSGVDIEFDRPTLAGRDEEYASLKSHIDDGGVRVSSLADIETMCGNVASSGIATTLVANDTGAVMLAMYLAAARAHGTNWSDLSITVQNDVITELAIGSPRALPWGLAKRLVTDVMCFAAEYAPRLTPLQINGAAIREAGATAVQELTYAVAVALEYVQWGVEAGLAAGECADRITFVFAAQTDVLEETAKYRAFKRLWPSILRDRFAVVQNSGCRFGVRTSPAPQQKPSYNNVVRVTLQSLTAFLGEASFIVGPLTHWFPVDADPALEERIQQVLAYEHLRDVGDALRGSFFVERLTQDIMAEATDELARLERLGGTMQALEQNYLQSKIAEARIRCKQALDRKERIIVGVNKFVDESPAEMRPHVEPATSAEQGAPPGPIRDARHRSQVEEALEELQRAYASHENLVSFLIGASAAYASVGEMCDTLRNSWREGA